MSKNTENTTNTENTGTDNIKVITKDQLAKMGYKVARTRKPVNLTGNPNADGKAMAKRYYSDLCKAYRRLESLVNGKVTRGKKEFALHVSKQQVEFMKGKIDSLNETVFASLSTGSRVANVEEFPD